MRVLFVSDVYFPRVNGVSTSVRTFRRDLASCGVATTLVAPDYAPAVSLPEADVVRVASGVVPGDPEDRRMRWGSIARTLAGFAPGAFDLVHVHTPFVAHYAGVRAARRLGIPCIETYHTFFEEYLHHYVSILPRALGRALARRFARSQCRQVAALVAPSEPLRAALLAYGVETPIYVIPTGLAPDRFKSGDGARFRAAQHISATRPLVLYVGRVAHEKNIGFLIRAFAKVRESVPQALFVIAGEGPARRSLSELVGELGVAAAVHFVGNLERDTELLDCYAAADVFVFASRTETQGLVLLEAMAQGAPVVSTAKLGTLSVLKNGCGALVVAEKLDAFAAAAQRVLQDPRLRTSLAEAARAYARQEWSSLSMARRLVELYGAVIERARRRGGARLQTALSGGV